VVILQAEKQKADKQMLNYRTGTELKFIHVISKIKMRYESSATLL
jgi:hypothetical protein